MPMLQLPEPGIFLDQLLSTTNTDGIDYSISYPEGRAVPLIRGIASLDNAQQDDISFLANPKLVNLLSNTQAGALILPSKTLALLPQPLQYTVVQCEDPYLLYARVSQWFESQRQATDGCNIHPNAVIDSSAIIGEDVCIGPFVVIGANVKIGRGCRIAAQCYIGDNCEIGAGTILHSHVTLYRDVRIGKRCMIHSQAVLAADGFGFSPDFTDTDRRWCKIAQLGGVTIGNDVEIGACTTIDRGALSDTIIGNDVKLDNQIMVGHNCIIGDHTAVAACAGIAGSTTIGKRCIIGGAAMFAGHITLVDDVSISGGSSVISDIKEAGQYTSVFPLAEHRLWQKNAAVISQLAQLRRRLRHLETIIDTNN